MDEARSPVPDSIGLATRLKLAMAVIFLADFELVWMNDWKALAPWVYMRDVGGREAIRRRAHWLL
eukprot:97459-Chlamydomonas_euryale.AAC.5